MRNNNQSKNSRNASIKVEKCLCADVQGLFIPRRQVSFVVASIVLLLFFSMIAGYFWGQRSAAQVFLAKIDQDAFADQIYSSVCALSDQTPLPVVDGSQLSPVPESYELEVHHAQEEQAPVALAAASDSDDANAAATSAYYAQLIGFSTSRAAYRCAEQLQKNGFPVKVKKRQSRTSKGRLISWYQVVTETFTDKMELAKLVDRIAKQAKLKDTRIVTC